MFKYLLECRYDARQSFYGKAEVVEDDNDGSKMLYSYGTHAASIKADKTAAVYNVQSATTLRHVKEFLKQEGFKAESKEQITRDYMSED